MTSYRTPTDTRIAAGDRETGISIRFIRAWDIKTEWTHRMDWYYPQHEPFPLDPNAPQQVVSK